MKCVCGQIGTLRLSSTNKFYTMKKQLLKMLFVFIVILFCIIPVSTNAQKNKDCVNGQCPNGFICVNGYCVKIKSGGGGGCNCFVRPIPYECGQICGWLAGHQTSVNNRPSISGMNSTAVRFELLEAQNVSFKIYDATGRSIKTLANEEMAAGSHEIKWNTNALNGKSISAGVYLLRIEAGDFKDTKKIFVIK